MTQISDNDFWNQRYQTDEYIFGTEPNAFLASQKHLFKQDMNVLVVADGEGRNGVWLAQQGLNVTTFDGSSVAVQKANNLAEKYNAKLHIHCSDAFTWHWEPNKYDAVVAIFIQFIGQELRQKLFGNIVNSIKKDGFFLLEGYRPEQLDYRTGGPSNIENLYTSEILQQELHALDIQYLKEYDAVINEGCAHHGKSALIDLIGYKKS